MIYHFCGISPYIEKYIAFLKENPLTFNLSEHFFVFYPTRNFLKNRYHFSGLQYSSTKSNWEFVKYLSKLKNTDSLIIHGLTNPRLFIYLFFINRGLIKRSIWSIWGGDVYYFKYANACLKNRFIEYLRKRIIPAIPIITSLVKGDYDIVKEIYKSDAAYVYSYYPIPIDNTLLKKIDNNLKANINKIILVGNSGDPSNNQIEILQHLVKYKDNEIQIICPLSYGDSNYIEKVIGYGKEVFRDRFIPLTDFIPPTEYSKILSKVSIAIMNHKRQQGLGSIINLLLLTKKVYIRSDTTSFSFFSNKGVKVFDTLNLNKMSLQELFYMDENTAKHNQHRISDIFSNEEAVRGWNNVFLECKKYSSGCK